MNNTKSLLFLSCLVAAMLTTPILTAAPRGGWGWGYPYYGYGYPYGYGYYGSGDPYGYGYGYGYGGNQYGGDYGYGNGYGNNGTGYGQYGEATHSKVAELQRRLARAGYYHGSVDGVLGPQTRRAIRAYERDDGYARNY